MKKLKSLYLVMALFCASILSLSLGTGCKTGPNGQKTLDVPNFSALTNYTTVAKIAAKDGTMIAIKAHPEWRSGFVQARDDLKVLAAADQVGFGSLLAIVGRLDVKELKGDTARMVISDVQIVLEDTVQGKFAVFDKNQSSDVAKLAGALAQGITIGLGD